MIARKTWREVRGMMLIYFVILQVLLLMAVLYWPTLEKEIHRVALDKLIPAEFMKRMVQGIRDIGYPAYLATQQFFKGVNIVGIACAVLIGTGAIAGEREVGTLELLLSRPVSRGRILWNKYWVLALSVLIPIFASSLSIPLMTKLIDPATVRKEPEMLHLLHASWHAGLFCLMFLTATMCISSFVKLQVQAAFWIGGVIMIQVGMYFVQELRKTSIFMLSDFDMYLPIMMGNRHFDRLFWSTEIWMCLATVVLYVIMHYRFKRMDL